MPESINFLTEDDVKILQEALKKIKEGRVNTPSRPPTERSFSQSEDHQGPETYIALPPDGGIPALKPTEDEGGYDEPGIALCTIWRIRINPATDLPELYQVEGAEKLVYNLIAREIPQYRPSCSQGIGGIDSVGGDTGTGTVGTGTSQGEELNWLIIRRLKQGKWVVDWLYSVCGVVGEDCITYVNRLEFDEQECVLTWCTRTTCFVAGTILSTSGEDCEEA